MSDQRRFAVVILAAGQGTRMRSDTHKVLHPIASRPLLLHLLDQVDALGADKRVVVVGKGREQVEAAMNVADGVDRLGHCMLLGECRVGRQWWVRQGLNL